MTPYEIHEALERDIEKNSPGVRPAEITIPEGGSPGRLDRWDAVGEVFVGAYQYDEVSDL